MIDQVHMLRYQFSGIDLESCPDDDVGMEYESN